MGISDRINDWVEGRREAWGGALGNFLVGAASKGVYKAFADMEPGAIDGITDQLHKLIDDPNTPDDIKAVLDKVLTPGNPLLIVAAVLIMVVGMTGTIGALFAPVNRALEYKVDRGVESFRMDPMSIITAWRRDPAKYAKLFDDLQEQGWSDEKIEALKFFTEFLPSPRDLVEWEAKEVFEPAMIEKYGLADEFETLDLSLFAKVGVTEEQARNFWIAHWEHASWLQVVEMVRRGLLEEKDVWEWFRLVEIPPYWRQKLIDISWEVPTRVDVRRFWDMRTIDEPRLREVYTAIGYHGKDLEDYVLWTKIYVDFPDLLARYKNGWISLETVRTELIAMGMKPERADTLIEEKIKKAAPERVAAEKDLTKADIIAGVKKGVITRLEAAELLTDIGYSNDEAIYLLDVNIPTDEETNVKTARELTKGDILAGLKAGVITEEDALAKLLELRYKQADADFILKVYKAAAAPPEEARLKEASKADIVTAVKKGLITQEAGYMMLLDIGFSAEAALFILSVATEESPFSPVNFSEFKDLTQKYRKASGLEGPPMNEALKRAAAEVIKLTTERDSLLSSVQIESRKLVGKEGLPEAATARLTQLQAGLRKAEAALAAAKTEYSRLVVEGKFT
jgi:hypothetical protein